MLTLRRPFHRDTFQGYNENQAKEVLVPPQHVAPYRNIHPLLSHIACKALSPTEEARYHSVDEMLSDLQVFLEGRPGWVEVDSFEHTNSSHLCSKSSFGSYIQIKAKIVFGAQSHAVGFLLPGGFELWLFAEGAASSGAITLKKNQPYMLRIEWVEGKVSLYIDDALEYTSIDYQPALDAPLKIEITGSDVIIEEGKILLHSSCFLPSPLAAADTLFSVGRYALALEAYKEKSKVLPATHFGYQALIKAGITLCHLRKKGIIEEYKKLLYPEAHPLRHLLEIHIFSSEKKWGKTVSSLKEAFQLFAKHPLISYLQEELLSLLQKGPYEPAIQLQLLALALRYIPIDIWPARARAHINQIETLFFFQGEGIPDSPEEEYRMAFALVCYFWLDDPQAIKELIDDALTQAPAPYAIIQNGLFALMELGAKDVVEEQLDKVFQRFLDIQAVAKLRMIQSAQEGDLDAIFTSLPVSVASMNLQPLWHVLDAALSRGKTKAIYDTVAYMRTHTLSAAEQEDLDCYHIWAHLLDGHLDQAKVILDRYRFDQFSKKPHSINFLYGAYLVALKGKKAALRHYLLVDESERGKAWKLLLQALKSDKKTRPHVSELRWEKIRRKRRLSLVRILSEFGQLN